MKKAIKKINKERYIDYKGKKYLISSLDFDTGRAFLLNKKTLAIILIEDLINNK